MFFGEYLVGKKVLTEDQVKKIIQIQNMMSSGERKLFGAIAVQLGFTENKVIDEKFKEFSKIS